MRIVDTVLNLIGWLQIAIGSALCAGLVWLTIFYFDSSIGEKTGIILTSIGFAIGGSWATCIWIKHGTVEWLSRIRRVK